MIKCACGGDFCPEDGLEGLFCNKCGAYMKYESATKDLYSDDKLKSIRGVPVNRIILGSESKGRIEVSVPMYASWAEQKALIDQQLLLLKYAKKKAEQMDLDIMPKR